MRVLLATCLVAGMIASGAAQTTSTTPALPHVIRFSGALRNSDGSPRTGIVGVMFSLYAQQQGGSALWTELQNVQLDANGNYTVLLGAQHPDGVPSELFTTNEARWLGIQVEADAEQPRILLVSVPYALKAGDAETLGGLPASAFVLAPTTATGGGTGAGDPTTASSSTIVPYSVNTSTSGGTAGYVARWADASTLGNSLLYDNGTNLGLGTTSPAAALDIQTSSATPTNALNVASTLTNSSPNSGIITALNLRVTDLSTATNVSKQTMRMSYIRDANATGSVSVFDTIFTATPIINSDAPYTLIGLNMEAPNVAAGKTLGTFYGALIGAGGSSGTVTNRYALATAPGSGNVGFNTTTPIAPLNLVADNPGGAERASQFVVQGSTNPNLKLNIGLHTEASPVYADLSVVEENVAWRNMVLEKNGGYVGIGTTTPSSRLTVAGTIESTTGGIKFPDGSVMSSANNISSSSSTNYSGSTSDQVLHVTQNGAAAGTLTVGTLPAAIRGDTTSTTNYTSGVLGTSSSDLGFGVAGENLSSGTGLAIGVFGVSAVAPNGTGVWGEAEATTGDSVGVFGKTFSSSGTGVEGWATVGTSTGTGDAAGVYGRSDRTGGSGVWGDATATSGATVGVYGTVASASGTAGEFDNTASGNLLIGRAGSGRTNVFRVDGSGRGYFNNGTQTNGADFAESFEVAGAKSGYEPGDLLIIDYSKDRRLALSQEPYSTLVAGIYSTKPGVLATPHEVSSTEIEKEVPLAVVGIVPCKASAENGAIHRGDLLVSSSIPGRVMKGTDRARMLGAVVGKALSNLDSGTGVIQVLVTLQ